MRRRGIYLVTMLPFAAIAAPTVLSGDFGRHDFHERAPSLEVHLLGDFCVLVDGAAVQDWPGGRARGLLQRLALDPWRAVPRDRLMAEFWPQRDPLAARNNLNVALHGLRRTLAAHAPGFAFIEHRRGCYGLNLAARLWTDVQAFESAHRLLMRCHVRRDHVHLAVRQYHACVETLQRELRLIPSPQTRALYREIRSRQAA
jgi:DNA-binding SARP family transcriptional activator